MNVTAPAVADSDAADFAALLRKIADERGVPCAGYKDSCLRRRISVRLRATGVTSFGAYARVLDSVPLEWERLVQELTINVTRFFRDTSAFAALEQRVYPLLRDRVPGTLRVWSAGCSHGQEAYSLAMGLAACVGLDRFCIEATDVDSGSLAAARIAEYGALQTADLPESARTRWMSRTEPSQVHAALRARVSVHHHDLLAGPMPVGRFHLITCRNVVIYFSREAQSVLFQQLHDALVPGGVLMLGKVETLVGPARRAFQTLDLRERLFQRSAT